MDPAAGQLIQTILEAVVAVVTGVPILLFGRRLFWLMGGLATAVIGMSVAALIAILIIISRYPIVLQTFIQAIETAQATQSSTLQLPEGISESWAAEANAAIGEASTQLSLFIVLAGLISGIAGALILIRFPRAASTLVGFVGGIFLLLQLFNLYSVNLPGWLNVLIAVVAGIVVAIIARRNPDTSLIVLSTVIGTIIIVEGLKFYPYSSLSAIVTLGLMLLGIIYQTGVLRRRQAQAKRVTTKPSPVT